MKYNWTNETFLPETIKNFPGAPSMTIVDMICASFFYNLLTMAISLLMYFPIVFFGRKIFKNNTFFSRVIIGFALTCTTPVFYFSMSNWGHNDYYLKKAEIMAWILCFIVSITSYVVLNKNKTEKLESA